MDDSQTLELLEATHEFPGPYMFKVIGTVEDGFAARVVAAVRDELEDQFDPPHQVRHTASGRHVSITLEPRVLTATQVLGVYRRVRQLAGVVMVW